MRAKIDALLRRGFAIAPGKALRMEMLATQAVFESIVLLRASSYEPGNRAGSVTGTNSVVCS